jgi:hypothetical protein
MGVMTANADPVARCPLVRRIGVGVQAILVLRREFLEVGAVLAEAFGDTGIGAQQGSVEGPVQGFDVGVAPLAVVIAQALATELQDLAGVRREAAVADPELTHRQVVFLGLPIVVVGVLGSIGLLQGVGLDDVGRGYRLTHGVGAPRAAFAIDPRTQVEAETVDVATALGTQVTVVLGLTGDFYVKAVVPGFFSHRSECRARPDQRECEADAGLHEWIQFHRDSSPSSSCRACSGSVFWLKLPRTACSCFQQALGFGQLRRRQLGFECLCKLGGLRGVLGLGQLAEDVGIERVRLGAFALGEQLGDGEVGTVLAIACSGQQMVERLLRIDLAQVTTAVDLAEVVIGGDFTADGFLEMFLGDLGVGRDHLAFVVQLAQQQLGARLIGGTTVVQVLHHLIDVAQFGKVVEQLREGDPRCRVARGDRFEQRLRSLFVRRAEGRIGQDAGDAVDTLSGHRAARMAGLHLLDQLGLLFRLGFLLVDSGQFDVADVGGVDRGFADLLHVVQMLVVGALGAIKQHLRQARFRLAFGAPLADLFLCVDVGEAVRILQVQHRQGDQGVAFASGGGFFQQGFGFMLLGFGGAGLGHQQATETRLGAR